MIFNKSIERKIIKGTDIMLTKLTIAVSVIDKATSPSANLVSTFDVTPQEQLQLSLLPKQVQAECLII